MSVCQAELSDVLFYNGGWGVGGDQCPKWPCGRIIHEAKNNALIQDSNPSEPAEHTPSEAHVD